MPSYVVLLLLFCKPLNSLSVTTVVAYIAQSSQEYIANTYTFLAESGFCLKIELSKYLLFWSSFKQLFTPTKLMFSFNRKNEFYEQTSRINCAVT